MDKDNNVQEVLEVNERQRDFYNNPETKKSLLSKGWSSLRNHLLSDFRRAFGIKDKVYDLHEAWMEDIELSDKRVLDLGCLRGNYLSLYMAQRAKTYVGIDLSDVAIAELRAKLEELDCPDARAEAVDFLSSDFKEKDFDLIYAYSVLHHFQDVDLLIDKLNEKLADGGKVIAYDPLATSFPIKVIRALYRPFQSDKDWEWPFTAKVLRKFAQGFNIKA